MNDMDQYYTVLISSRRNLSNLNKFLISDKILINYRELYFEVVGHVYLNKMGNFPKMRCSVSKVMSKMTHVNYKNTNNCFQIGDADSIQLFHTFLCNSQNYHPRGAVDDPMHCCPRPNSASGHPQHRGGDSFDCCTERYEIVVLLPNSEDTCYWKYFLKFE